MRRTVLPLLLLLISACGGSNAPVPPTGSEPDPVVPTGNLVSKSITSGGGTLTVSLAGSPLNGVTLQIPAGAMDATGTVTLGSRAAATTGFPANLIPRTPVLRITTTAGNLKQPALLRFVLPATPGATRIALALDPATGETSPLPTIISDAAGITVALPNLHGGGVTAGLRDEAKLLDGAGIDVLMFDILDIDKNDYDTGYRPGVDDWDFPRQPIGPMTATTTGAVDPGQAMVGTSMWYFMRQKAAGGPLWQRFQLAKGIPESNRAGLRWVGITGPTFTSYWLAGAVATTMNTEVQGNPAAGRTQLQNIRVRMAPVTRAVLPLFLRSAGLLDPDWPSQPVPVLLYAGSSANAPKIGLAYRVAGNAVDLAIPDQPGVSFRAEFDASGTMTPFTVTTNGGGTFTVTAIAIGSFMNLLLESQLNTEWPTVVAGTIGDSEGWATPDLRGQIFSETGNTLETLKPADVPLVDPLPHWWRCLACPVSGYSINNDAVDSRLLLWRRVSRRTDGTYGPLPATLFTEASFAATDITPGLEATSGFALYQPGPGSSKNSANGTGWLDWQTVRYRKIPAAITPADPSGSTGTDIALTLTLTGPPGNLEYQWDFADGPRVITTTLATAHKWANVGTYPISVLARDKTSKQQVAKASATVEVTAPLQAWKFTSMSATFISTRPQLDGWDSRWSVDSQIVARIANGITAGGFRIVDQPFTPTGFPLRTAPAGLYLLEGASLTLANLLSPATQNSFSLSTFPNALLNIPAAPQVSSWNLVEKAAPVNVLCSVHIDSYAMNGTVTQGSLVALRVPLCVQSFNFPNVNGRRLMSMDVDVTFAAATATGTISVIYYWYGNGTLAQTFERTARLSFVATRITQ